MLQLGGSLALPVLFRAAHDSHTGAAHLFNRRYDIALLQLDAAAGVFDAGCFEPQSPRIQGRELHAIIRRQPADVNAGRAAIGEPLAQARGAPVSIVEKTTVAVDRRIGALLKDLRDARGIERRDELGP